MKNQKNVSGFKKSPATKSNLNNTSKVVKSTPTSNSPFQKFLNTEISAEIKKMAVGGDGVAKIDYEGRQITVFIPRTAIGDTVRFNVTEVEKNFMRGEVLQILSPSATRIQPLCDYYKNCGGCNWQHVNYDSQISFKEEILLDLVKKFLPNQDISLQATTKSPENYGYRNRIQLKALNGDLGYFKRKSHDIIPIAKCVIADALINENIISIKSKLKNKPELEKFELKKTTDQKFEYYRIGVKGEGLSFSQVNEGVNALLVKKVLTGLESIKPTEMTELYAGAGNFTLPILHKFSDLVAEAVELNSDLTLHLKSEAAAEKVQRRLTVFTANCENFVVRRALSSHFVLLDPPRAGCEPVILEKLVAARTKNIFYISCNPVALVRDLAALLKKNSAYKIREMQIFDMFPQTDHFETFVWIEHGD